MVIQCKYLSRSICTAVGWTFQTAFCLWGSWFSTHFCLLVLVAQRVEQLLVRLWLASRESRDVVRTLPIISRRWPRSCQYSIEWAKKKVLMAPDGRQRMFWESGVFFFWVFLFAWSSGWSRELSPDQGNGFQRHKIWCFCWQRRLLSSLRHGVPMCDMWIALIHKYVTRETHRHTKSTNISWVTLWVTLWKRSATYTCLHHHRHACMESGLYVQELVHATSNRCSRKPSCIFCVFQALELLKRVAYSSSV